MSRIADYYEKYVQTYESYQKKNQQIHEAHKEAERKRQKLEEARAAEKEINQNKIEAENKFGDANDALEKYIPVYEEESKRRSIEPALQEYEKSLVYFDGDLTQPGVFESSVEDVNAVYDKKKQDYYEERKQELEFDQSILQIELDDLEKDPKSFLQKRKDEICEGCDQVVEGKKEEIIQYLSCNSQIRNSDSAKRIQKLIGNNSVVAEECGTSEENLLEEVLALKGTSGYPRSEKVTVASVKRNKDGYKNFALPFLIGIGIAIALIFVFVFSPMSMVIPSGESIAGAGHAVIQTIIRILCAGIGGACLGGILYGILTVLGLHVIGIISGILFGILGILYIYGDHYIRISENSFMGFGNVSHGILVWLFQIVLIGVFLMLLNGLIKNTGLVRIFFKPKKNMVMEGIKDFEEYVTENKEKFIALFQLDKALEYACENRIMWEISQNKESIEHISKEEEYLKIEEECNKEIENLSQKRKLEEEKTQQSFLENKSKKDEKRKQLTKEEDERILEVERHLAQLKEALKNAENVKKELEIQLVKETDIVKKCTGDLEESLTEERVFIDNAKAEKIALEDTTKNIFLPHNELKGTFRIINNVKALLECQGNLEKNIYFVRNKKDEEGMAVVRKKPLSCKPTVCIYQKDYIKGDNLSEELSHLIQWLYDSMRRVIPSAILSKFSVVDMVSGRSVLHISPYNEYLDVITDETSKVVLSEALKEREVQIIAQCNRQDLGREEVVNSINTLNQIKMIRNKEEIDKYGDTEISDLLEELIPYRVIIFILPANGTNSVQPSVLNENLKQSIKSSERFGVLPIFLVDNECWDNRKSNSDVDFLHEIQDKVIWNVLNVGKKAEEKLDIIE